MNAIVLHAHSESDLGLAYYSDKTLCISSSWGEVEQISYNGKIFTPADAWPEPITDRDPTEDDADEDGDIQYMSEGGWFCKLLKELGHMDLLTEGWQHTPIWEPPIKPVYTRSDVLQLLRERHAAGTAIGTSVVPSHCLAAAIALLEDD